eukprot:463076-Ditylum_brightwellii.AAC.1
MVDVELPSTLQKIERGAFKGCISLTSMKVPEGTEEIGSNAFRSCCILNEVELPPSVKSIGDDAFDGCELLRILTLPLIPDVFEKDLFKDKKSLTKVTFSSCPSELETEPLEGNTFLHACVAKDYPSVFVAPLVKLYPSVLKQRNILGQTPLHLCLSNNVSAEVTKEIYDAYPDAVSAKNELSKTPLDYWRENREDEVIGDIIRAKASATTPVTAFLLKKDRNAIMMDEDPFLLRGHHLLLEVMNTHNNLIYTNVFFSDAKEFGNLFLEQLRSRNLLFNKLLTEFSNLIGFKNKQVIQRAAAAQALCSTHLTAGKEQHVDFQSFSSTALWYQQEILSLVMRVYCEDQLMDNLVGSNDSYYVDYVPSAVRDAHKCKQDIEEKKITPSTHRTKSFHALIDFLVDGLQEGGDYEIQGP